MKKIKIGPIIFLLKGIIVACLIAAAFTGGSGKHATPTPKPVAPTTTVDYRTLPACQSDDGTPHPCFWNAQEQGNGQGTSFWTDQNGGIHPVK